MRNITSSLAVATALYMGCGTGPKPPSGETTPVAQETTPVVQETPDAVHDATPTPTDLVDDVFRRIREGTFEVLSYDDSRMPWPNVLKDNNDGMTWQARANEEGHPSGQVYRPKPSEWLFSIKIPHGWKDSPEYDFHDPYMDALGLTKTLFGPMTDVGHFQMIDRLNRAQPYAPFYERMREENPSDETLSTYYTILARLPENVRSDFFPLDQKVAKDFAHAKDLMASPIKLRLAESDGFARTGLADKESVEVFLLERDDSGEWIKPTLKADYPSDHFLIVNNQTGEPLKISPLSAFLVRRGPRFTEMFWKALEAFDGGGGTLTQGEYIQRYRAHQSQRGEMDTEKQK